MTEVEKMIAESTDVPVPEENGILKIYLTKNSTIWANLAEIDPEKFIFKNLYGEFQKSEVCNMEFVKNFSKQLYENCTKTVPFLQSYLDNMQRDQCLTISELQNFCEQTIQKILVYKVAEKSVNLFSTDLINPIIAIFNKEYFDHSVKLRKLSCVEDTRRKVVEAFQNIHNLQLKQSEIDEISLQLIAFSKKIMFDALRFVFQFRQIDDNIKICGSKSFPRLVKEVQMASELEKIEEKNNENNPIAEKCVNVENQEKDISELSQPIENEPMICFDTIPDESGQIDLLKKLNTLSRLRLAQNYQDKSIWIKLNDDDEPLVPLAFDTKMIHLIDQKTYSFLNTQFEEIRTKYNRNKKLKGLRFFADHILSKNGSRNWKLTNPTNLGEYGHILARYVSKCLDYLLNSENCIMYSEAWDNYIQCLIIENPENYYDETRFMEMAQFMHITFIKKLGPEFDESEKGKARLFHFSFQFLRFVTTLAMDLLRLVINIYLYKNEKNIKSIVYARKFTTKGRKTESLSRIPLLKNYGCLWPENEKDQLKKRKEQQGKGWKTDNPFEIRQMEKTAIEIPSILEKIDVQKTNEKEKTEEDRKRRNNKLDEDGLMIKIARSNEEEPEMTSFIKNNTSTWLTSTLEFLRKLGEPNKEVLKVRQHKI